MIFSFFLKDCYHYNDAWYNVPGFKLNKVSGYQAFKKVQIPTMINRLPATLDMTFPFIHWDSMEPANTAIADARQIVAIWVLSAISARKTVAKIVAKSFVSICNPSLYFFTSKNDVTGQYFNVSNPLKSNKGFYQNNRPSRVKEIV
ncbi:MAG: hypothetical protein AMK70_05485 [Nitrospira bacterium SG8_35_1]|nr:MAG: hypothetical protein AMK70_05485 [Nitrospira bacterium SG8_35_1]